MPKPIVIAIDGLSSSGKSTIAKQLAAQFDLKFIDSGAFYRAITLYILRHDILFSNAELLNEALQVIEIEFQYEVTTNQSKVFLNGENVESEIRNLEVSQMVSAISAIPQVRTFVSEKIRNTINEKGLVIDGRDIGTVVFPDASLKIYLTADEKVRSERRFEEMKSKSINVTQKQIRQNISGRDLLDTTRAMSPLKKADDAYVIDNTSLSMEEQLVIAGNLVKEIIQAK